MTSTPEPVRVGAFAMATRFEIALFGAAEARLRAAGEAALAEVARLELILSAYLPDSQLSDINANASLREVRVDGEVFSLIERAREVWETTGGAFDITVGPLIQAWGFRGSTGSKAGEQQLLEAKSRVGMEHVVLDRSNSAVRFERPGMSLDLGALGKGYAVERACLVLRECGVDSALVHGGTSSVQAIGTPPDQPGWKVAVSQPHSEVLLATVLLRDSSLSVSGVHGKSFEMDGVEMGHVIDPRTGWPTTGASLAAVQMSAAALGDAVSTALLVIGADGIQSLSGSYPDAGMAVLTDSGLVTNSVWHSV